MKVLALILCFTMFFGLAPQAQDLPNPGTRYRLEYGSLSHDHPLVAAEKSHLWSARGLPTYRSSEWSVSSGKTASERYTREAGRSKNIMYTDAERLVVTEERDYDPFYQGHELHRVYAGEGLIIFRPHARIGKEYHQRLTAQSPITADELPPALRTFIDHNDRELRLYEDIKSIYRLESKGDLELGAISMGVHRIRVYEHTHYRVQAKLGGQWVDRITDAESELLNHYYTERIHYFPADGPWMPLVTLELVETEAQVRMLDIPSPYRQRDPIHTELRQDLQISPNPTFGKSRYQMIVPEPGRYYLTIKSILGRVIRREEIHLEQRQADVQMDVSYLRKGSYFCSISDSKGRALVSRKLVILKP